MADEKLNTGPAENISPEAAEPITTPEQAAASEPQQEQTGPAPIKEQMAEAAKQAGKENAARPAPAKAKEARNDR